MVLTFVRAANDLGINTVAEGIECRDEGETCRQLGFEYAQGYFYGKPLPIGEFAVT
jgi:EAL domain-containing protein (putative c-di-GMP-specific phosphodiesterase class I)